VQLEALIEKYEREVWENESYYVGVIDLIAQDSSDLGKDLYQFLKVQEKQETQQERYSPSTYELLKDSVTAKNLKVVLADDQFKEYGGTAEERLQEVLKRVHTVAEEFVDRKMFDTVEEKTKNPELVKYCHEVVAPGIEWYLLELLKGKEGEDNHANNQQVLGLLQNVSFESLTSAFK